MSSDQGEQQEIPVDAPNEPAVWSRSTRRFWAVLLAGPVIWIVHFAVVYLAAETACTPTVASRWPAIDEESLRAFIVVATLVAAAAGVIAAVVAWRAMRAPDASPLTRAAVVLAIGSVASVIAVGGPVLVLGPC